MLELSYSRSHWFTELGYGFRGGVMNINEQLQTALSEMINKSVDGIESSVAFMQQELPDVIEQLLMWYMVKGLMWVVFGFVLILLTAAFWKKVYACKPNKDGESNWAWSTESLYRSKIVSLDEFTLFAGGTASFISLLVGIPVILVNIVEPIKIWIAPKIWLIEYAAQLVK